MRKIIIATLMASAMIGCGKKEDAQAESESNPLKITFDKIAAKCPGLSEHATSLALGQPLAPGIYYDGGFQSGLEGLRVAEASNPDNVDAWTKSTLKGNRCDFFLTKNGDRVVTMKDECASLCTGEKTETNGSNFEKR